MTPLLWMLAGIALRECLVVAWSVAVLSHRYGDSICVLNAERRQMWVRERIL